MTSVELSLSHWQQLLQPIEASKNWAYLVEQATQALAEGGENGAVEEAYLSYLAGKGLCELKNWSQAETLLLRSVDLHPDFPFSFHLLGLCKAEAEEWHPAYCAAIRSTDMAPDFAYGWHARGYAALQLGNNKEAKICLERAIELNKTISWFHSHYALAEVRLALADGDVAEAAAAIADLLAAEDISEVVLQEWLAAAATCALAGEKEAARLLATALANGASALGSISKPIPKRAALLILVALGENTCELRELAWMPSNEQEKEIWCKYVEPLYRNWHAEQVDADLKAVLKVVIPHGSTYEKLLEPLEVLNAQKILEKDQSKDPRLPFLHASAHLELSSHNLQALQNNIPKCLEVAKRRIQQEPRQHLPLQRLDHHLWQLNTIALAHPDLLAQETGLLSQALVLRDGAIEQLCEATISLTNIDGMEPLERHHGAIDRWLLVGSDDLPQCFFYRVEQKKQQLEALGCDVQVLTLKDLNSWSFSPYLLWAQAIIICRLPATYPVLRFMARAKRAGIIVFYDIDDLIFDPHNFPPPLTSYGGTIGIKVHRGLALDVSLFRRAMDQADGIIVSTRCIAERWLQLARRGGQAVMVLPNHASTSLIDACQPIQNRGAGLRLVFASGTLAHKEVWNQELAPALKALMEFNPTLRLDLVGHVDVPEQLLKQQKRIRCKPYCDYKQYLHNLSQADIGVAVLEEGIVTDSKSAIKWMEYSMMGLASVVSPTSNYLDILSHGKDVLFARGAVEWQTAIQQLIDDPEYRFKLAKQAQERSIELFADNQDVQFWKPLIKGLMSEPKQQQKQQQKRFKLLVVNVFFAPQSVGGATRIAQDQVYEVIKQAGDKFDVTVLCVDHDSWQGPLINNQIPLDIHQWNGAKVVRLGLPAKPWSYHHDGEIEYFCRWWLKQEQFDLIHAHCLQIITAAPLVVAAELGIPYVVSLHDGWWLSELQFLITNEGRKINPADPLSHLNNEINHPKPVIEAVTQRNIDLRKVLKKAAMRWAVSNSFADLYRQAGIKDVSILENSYTSMQVINRIKRLNTDPLRICNVGGMAIHKGYPVFREAFHIETINNAEITVIDHSLNDGEVYTAIWNNTPVIFQAPCPMEAMADFYSTQDVLVASSIWPESYGLVTREALSAGLWVIASDIGALAEPILEGVNGNKFAAGDAKALAELLMAQAISRSTPQYSANEISNRKADATTQLLERYEQAIYTYQPLYFDSGW